ncbi:response regulator [Halomicrobium katesii]|uniref:response regulator n=1 Tax=Halomicrobium katesii TaxID=437163 RepID=UPI000376FB55|nr:response regulator [Halomicrobium katesii]
MNLAPVATILVVDDSDFFLEITSETLEEKHGLNTRTASTGSEALAVMRDQQIDCVVSDYEMPSMDGLELHKAIDAEFDVPFILLTGQGDETVASEAIGAGIDDYLLKTRIIDGEQLQLLANRIDNVVSQYEARRKYEQLVDNTPDEIVEVTSDGMILSANTSMASSHGMTREQVIGERLSSVIDPDVAAKRLEYGRRATTAGSAVTFQDNIGVRQFHNIVTPRRETADHETVQFISRDITQQKRHEQQLETKTEELALINRLVRHDINNDVQLLMGWAGAVAPHVDEDGVEYLERIQDTCDHIAELTANVGAFTDALEESGAVDFTPIELSDVIASEVTKSQRRFEDATIRVEGALPTVTIEANGAVQAVFGNLLSNAVHHNETDDPHITVTMTVTDTVARVTVADNGPGISDEFKPSVFDKDEMGKESDGTGIGLYLVETLVEQYGGDIWIDDNDPRGAAFTVELPRSDLATYSSH